MSKIAKLRDRLQPALARAWSALASVPAWLWARRPWASSAAAADEQPALFAIDLDALPPPPKLVAGPPRGEATEFIATDQLPFVVRDPGAPAPANDATQCLDMGEPGREPDER